MRLGYLGLLFLLAGQPAAAQSGFSGETMLLPIPDGFVEGFTNTDGAYTITEYVPEGESTEDWTRMLTVQLFRDANSMDVMEFLDALAASLAAACEGSESSLVAEGETSGLPTVQALFFCPGQEGGTEEEVFLAHVIGGRDSLYVSQMAWRGAPSQENLEWWSAFLRRMDVCDTRREDMLCPQ